MQQRLRALRGMAKDTGYLAYKVSKQIGQGKWTKCSDPNETMCPDQCVGTHSVYQFEETQGEGSRGGGHDPVSSRLKHKRVRRPQMKMGQG